MYFVFLVAMMNESTSERVQELISPYGAVKEWIGMEKCGFKGRFDLIPLNLYF